MSLDNAIKIKEDKIKELQKTIDAFNKEIESLKEQTKNVKAERIAASRQTAADLDARIPILRQEKVNLETSIENLKKIVVENQKAADEASKNAEAHYKNLEAELMKEYKKLHADLKSREDSLTAATHNHRTWETSLTQRESTHQLSLDNHAKVVADFDKKVKETDERHLATLADIENKNAALDEKNSQVSDRENQVINSERNLHARDQSLKNREVQASAIMDRINEANGILAQAQAKEDANKKRTDELNELNVKLIAERNRNTAQSDALVKKARELDKQAEDLKIAREGLLNGQA